MDRVVIYKLLHLSGVFMLFIGYGALIARAFLDRENKRFRMLGSITSGVGLLLLLVGGFGMLARYGYNVTDGWVLAKLVIWFILGGLMTVANRKPEVGGVLWWVVILLGVVAAYMALFKPF